MAILLLTQGDLAAKELLRRAIAARYYNSPPTLETLRIEYRGRGFLKLGPVQSWIPLDLRLYFHFPDALRWDYTLKPFGLPLQRGTGSYLKNAFYSEHRSATITNPALREHLRLAIWSVGAMLLTPLSQPTVRVDTKSARSFVVINTATQDELEMQLNPDYTIASISFSSMNPEIGQPQQMTLQPSSELVDFNGVLIPRTVRLLRDGAPAYEAEAISITCNPSLTTSFFQPGYASV